MSLNEELRESVSEAYQTIYANQELSLVERRRMYGERRAELEQEWKENYLFPMGHGISSAALEVIFLKAWADGHSDGYYQVEYCFTELVELVGKVLDIECGRA